MNKALEIFNVGNQIFQEEKRFPAVIVSSLLRFASRTYVTELRGDSSRWKCFERDWSIVCAGAQLGGGVVFEDFETING